MMTRENCKPILGPSFLAPTPAVDHKKLNKNLKILIIIARILNVRL